MLEKITKPSLMVNKAITLDNISRMLEKTKAAGAIFRPHFKTHQSGVVGQWFRSFGIHKITVSSVSMAQYFALHGWKDITIAFPVNLRELPAINHLALSAKINLLVESIEVINALETGLDHISDVYIKVDVGAARTGIAIDNSEAIISLAEQIKSKLKLKLAGFLSHAGQTYKAKGITEIEEIARCSQKKLFEIKEKLKDPSLILSWGDTPSCSMLPELNGFDEWRPGNFVFYDIMQYHIGSCELNDIAVAMACPVVAVHPERNQIVVYGGAIHFSKERIIADNGFELYGYVVEFTENGWSKPIAGAWLSSLSQEHGIVNLPSTMIQQFRPGDIIGILPVHSCLAVSAMNELISIEGEIIPCFKG
ncbi:MAG: alanine racemase [Bacteroidales bacterium]|nr:alanine racemase [Bacteroidales bacterium]